MYIIVLCFVSSYVIMFTILDYSSALEYSIIMRYTNIVYYYYYTTNIPAYPQTITATDIKTNMRHIHTSIVSRHLATRGHNKILRTPPPHIRSADQILPRLSRRTLAQLRTNNLSSLNHTYTQSTPNHIHYH